MIVFVEILPYITLVLVMLLMVRMNFESENAIVEYWQFKNKEERDKLVKDWHRYDAIVRLVIVPYIVYLHDFDIIDTTVLSFTILFWWMILFNLFWNLKRTKNIKGKPDIFYLGDYAATDLFIKKINSKIEDILTFFKRKKGNTKQKVEINYRITNAIIQFSGLLISTIACLLTL